MIRRRDLVAIAGGAVATWPPVGRAQQAPAVVIGFLNVGSAAAWAPFVAAFRSALKEAGYIEGRNLQLEFRWADGRNDRLPALAAELVQQRVSLIVASPGVAVIAAKSATTTIPILFQVGGDPVKLGLVASFNRPGGNLTGVSQLAVALTGKRVDLLRYLAPRASVMAMLGDPESPTIRDQMVDFEQAVGRVGLRPLLLIDRDFDSVFQRLAGHAGDVALIVAPSGYLVDQRKPIIGHAARHKIPAMYELREFVQDGGLISYGTDISDVYRQLGSYAGKILKGAKPADLPVVQPTRFEMLINLRTARALGLEVPPTLHAIADEVIE
jgi:putative ABC transport system substrate-binding protein